MKRKVGIICIILGVFFLVGAATLLFYNHTEDERAFKVSKDALEKITEYIESAENIGDAEDVTESSLNESANQHESMSDEMLEVVIDSNVYVGYLSLPTLDLELPVLANTDQELLRVAPCRFKGTVNGNNLVIGAHNYQSHFGRLTELSVGDTVAFTDMNGLCTSYTVASLEILDPYAVEDLTAGEYPLTLYTCTYGGASRVTVRLDREN